MYKRNEKSWLSQDFWKILQIAQENRRTADRQLKNSSKPEGSSLGGRKPWNYILGRSFPTLIILSDQVQCNSLWIFNFPQHSLSFVGQSPTFIFYGWGLRELFFSPLKQENIFLKKSKQENTISLCSKSKALLAVRTKIHHYIYNSLCIAGSKDCLLYCEVIFLVVLLFEMLIFLLMIFFFN